MCAEADSELRARNFQWNVQDLEIKDFVLFLHLGFPIRHNPGPREYRAYASRPPAYIIFFSHVHRQVTLLIGLVSRAEWIHGVHKVQNNSFIAQRRVFQLGTIFSNFLCFCFFRDILEFLNIHGEP